MMVEVENKKTKEDDIIIEEEKDMGNNGDWIPIKECSNFPIEADRSFVNFYIDQLKLQKDDSRVEDIETFLYRVNSLWRDQN